MGVQQSNGRNTVITAEEREKLFRLPFSEREDDEFCSHILSDFAIISPDDPDRDVVKASFQKFLKGVEEKVEGNYWIDARGDKAVACMFGNLLGDAFGAPAEFSHLRYGKTEYTDFSDAIWKKGGYNRFRLKPGQWTDDASMMLCLADSLLVCRGFDGIDLRLRFLNWWKLGYNNAFGWDEERKKGGAGSVGLGGNISGSMEEFTRVQEPFTSAGDKVTSGNGSVMRNAPSSLFYAKDGDVDEACETAYKQSKTTHQGDEAAECCRLLTFVTLHFVAGQGKDFLEDLGSVFKSPLYTVQCLASGIAEEEHEENRKLKLSDRVWTWKDPNFKYSPTRSEKQPGYIGSYAMDAMAMSLHCLYTTTSFQDALVKCANLRGDSDSVCAVLGQMAGALYGLENIPLSWLQTLLRWDPDWNIPLRAYKLYTHNDCVLSIQKMKEEQK